MLNIESQVPRPKFLVSRLSIKQLLCILIIIFTSVLLLSFIIHSFLISEKRNNVLDNSVHVGDQNFIPNDSVTNKGANSESVLHPNKYKPTSQLPNEVYKLQSELEKKNKNIEQLMGDLSKWQSKYVECEKNGPVTSHPGDESKIGTISSCPSMNEPYNDTPEYGVIVFAHKRANYLQRCLEKLFQYKPMGNKFKIFVSQDGFDKSVESVAKKFPVTLWQRDQSTLIKPDKVIGSISYYHISQHYKFGLQRIFEHEANFKNVIILEEDIEISPDFYEYFEATAPLLEQDKTIYCISAFNDNGMGAFVSDPLALYRSDFFPGLGWLMSRELWNEVKEKWPIGFWDDWLRQPVNRKGRACIRPEISRTYTFGAVGVSQGQFYSQYLKNIQLSSIPINWSKLDLSYLKKATYDSKFQKQIDAAEETTMNNLSRMNGMRKDLKIYFNSIAEFDKLTRALKIMTDKKDGVPRGAYQGVVAIRYQQNRLFLVPKPKNMLYRN